MPASGGHLSPGLSDDPLFDPLTAPLPSEREAARTRPGGPSVAEPLDEYAPEREARPQAPPARRRRVVTRRVKRTIKHVDPISILKLSLFFYAVLLIVWLIVVAILYSIVDSLGVFDVLEEVGRGFELRELENNEITLGLVEKWAFLIGILFAVVASVINMFLAILYNIAADVLGGVEVTFQERDFH